MVTKIGMTVVLASGSINLGKFFDNSKSAIKSWGGSFIGLIGAFMLVAGADLQGVHTAWQGADQLADASGHDYCRRLFLCWRLRHYGQPCERGKTDLK